jgi:hypothetical protein
MANDKHVAILKKGVVAWNVWRDEGTRNRRICYGTAHDGRRPPRDEVAPRHSSTSREHCLLR